VADADDRIRDLESQLAERDERIAKLEAMVEKLRELLERNSSNSSMPPSTDRGKNPKRNAKKGKKRGKRGAKKGHKGSHRALLPPEKVDETHERFPAACKGCGGALDATSHGDPERHQVTEIPPLRAHTTEYRLHSVECACGCVTKAELPEGVTRGAFGPTLVSFVALLTGVYRLSKRGCADALETLFGIKMSTGSVSRCEKEVSDAVKASHAEAAAAARQAATGYADETSWQQEAKTHWLWVLVTSVATVFLIRKGRTKEVAKELLGKFAGTLVSDRLKSYGFWNGPHQICWAHLIRLFTKLSESDDGTYRHRVGTRALDAIHDIYREWRRFQDGEIRRATLKRRTVDARRVILAELRFGKECGESHLGGKCRAVLEYEHALFTFLFVDDVEPTNNQAERAIRHAVILRKLSFGTQSDRGSRFLERVFTVVETLRRRDADVASFLHEAVVQHRLGRPAPSLLAA